MKKIIYILSIVFVTSSLYAKEINAKQLAEDLEIVPNHKVKSQWKRIFKNEKRMERYGISYLTKEEQKVLEKYILKHAKDAYKEEGF